MRLREIRRQTHWRGRPHQMDRDFLRYLPWCVAIVAAYETQPKLTDTLILTAEMALATLQGAIVPGVTPPFCLALSHSPSLEECLPEDRLFHQFVKCTTNTRHVLYDSSAQDVFSWFRSAGPLVSVRVNVNVGHAYATCVLEYWEDTHAQYARTHCRMMHPALAAMDHFSLRTYNPCTIFCTVYHLRACSQACSHHPARSPEISAGLDPIDSA